MTSATDPQAADHVPSLVFACPFCTSMLTGSLSCHACGRDYSHCNGIYRFLLPERSEAIQSFLSQYRLVRNSEGYHSRPAQYYRSLPHTDPLDPQAQIWRVRAETFEHLLRQVLGHSGHYSATSLPASSQHGGSSQPRRGATILSNVESDRTGAPLDVLDIGAGNGWLSHRLAALGHRCVALDCSDDAEDGLGAFVQYSVPFTCVQADFDQLPFAHHQFNIVIFNASLHYSADIQATLHHAHNMLLPGGALVVMDSPTFWYVTGAQSMLTEQAARLRAQSGAPQLVIQGVGYTTADALVTAGQHLGVQFRFAPSRGSANWALRRFLAGLKRRREPASFGLWYGFT